MSEKTGAVLVLGSGIGGIQAALDLADQGFKVYLVDRRPSIGGTMAQLDKTFPTNDCTMCLISPKLVDCGRHPNIELITYAELLDISGEAGDFKVRVKKHSGFVDPEKCTGCGECAQVCPVSVKSEFDQGMGQRKAIYKLYPQAIPNVYVIDKTAGKSPCRANCPIDTRAQGYIALIARGKFDEALGVITEDNPFPSICGRVCRHPCETNCKRNDLDQPLAVASLKRAATDYGTIAPIQKPTITKSEKVAIIGSGPAGLTAAWELIKLGYGVTVFEALEVLGGMLRIGIPEYRLPRDLLDKEIQNIIDLGIEVKTNTRFGNPQSGEDITIKSLFADGYKAVFIAVGAQASRMLGIEGEDCQGVYPALDFLKKVNLGQQVKLGEKVAVFGGGNTAIDAARTACRLGAKTTTIFYRRSRQEMPAAESEIEEAEKEGIVFEYLTSPLKILEENGRVVGAECIKMELGATDKSGRRRPIPIPGSEFTIQADTILSAIGQALELSSFQDSELKIGRNALEVDKDTLATNIQGVFAGGDVATGAATVIEAIWAGKRCAVSIDRYFKGKSLTESQDQSTLPALCRDEIKIPDGEPRRKRQVMPTLPVEERRNFVEVELGFSKEMAIAEAQRCLSCAVCAECFQCVKVCEAEAINHQRQDQVVELDVGALILAAGFQAFDPAAKPEYNYIHSKNIVAAPEFERILSASGPYQGHLVRPSDQKEPKKIAFLQCVGSRDQDCNPYCSSVCCMYATKEAVVAKEHAGYDLTTDIYYMDIRAHGKGFDRYYERAKKEYKVNYRRCRLPRVENAPDGSGDLTLSYITEAGKQFQERYDMVVLSVGLTAPRGIKPLAGKLGIELNDYDFVSTPEFYRELTSREGVFVCGAITEPKDIPETVIQASAAAAAASALLAEARGSLIKKKEYPPEIATAGEAPRIGVFICHCGINIAGTVDVVAVTEYIQTLPDVACVEHNLYTCSQDTQQKIKETILEKGLNRVVIASCTPRTHEALFQDTIREVGLNPFLLEFVSIREHCSWVHNQEKEKATEKAKELVKMAVAKAKLLEPLQRASFSVNKKGLVLGGGISGMQAALSLAEQDFEVFLVERGNELGGNLRRLFFDLGGEDPQKLLGDTIREVENNDKIHVYKGASIEEFSGYVGNFKTKIKLTAPKAENIEIEHGIVIVATGAKERETKEYLYGKNEKVVSQKKLEEKLASEEEQKSIKELKSVVMIQCVGSREDSAPYCSRICCSDAIKNALKLKEINPEIDIFVLYRDIRTYGFRELFYKEARDKGVIFISYEKEKKPEVKEIPESSQLLIEVDDPILGQKISFCPDLLVLSTGMAPEDGNKELAQILKIPLNEDGFFLESHIKLRPVDFSSDGIYLCGLAHSPKSVDEAISQARAAAGRAVTLLSQDAISSSGRTVKVNERLCAGCGLCVTICPYQARHLDELTGKAKVMEVLCQGCGACVVACPSGASQQYGFTKKELLDAVDALAL